MGSVKVTKKLEIKIQGKNGVSVMLENIDPVHLTDEGPFAIAACLEVCKIANPVLLQLPQDWTQRFAPGHVVSLAVQESNLQFSIRDQANKLLGVFEIDSRKLWTALDFNSDFRWDFVDIHEIEETPGLFYGQDGEGQYMIITDKATFFMVVDYYQNHSVDKVWHIKKPQALYDVCTSSDKDFKACMKLIPNSVLEALNTNPAYHEHMNRGRFL